MSKERDTLKTIANVLEGALEDRKADYLRSIVAAVVADIRDLTSTETTAPQSESEAVRLLKEDVTSLVGLLRYAAHSGRDAEWLFDRQKGNIERIEQTLSRPPGPDYQQQAVNWEESARFHCKNEEYYRGLVQQIGDMLGPEAYISDDGSVQQDVLCAKVPELVKARLSGHDWRTLAVELRDSLAEYRRIASGTRPDFRLAAAEKAVFDALAYEAAATGKGGE